jgi:hypothetical protein
MTRGRNGQARQLKPSPATPTRSGRPARKRGQVEVRLIESADPIDAEAWARRYVLAVLRLEGVLLPAGPSNVSGSNGAAEPGADHLVSIFPLGRASISRSLAAGKMMCDKR